MESTHPGPWILKPSVTNKAANIALVSSYRSLRSELAQNTDIREWVLQVYLSDLLLYRNRKFHIRVYVLAGVHTLRVLKTPSQ
jgi:hypothetical protein